MTRAVGRSEYPGVQVLFGGHNLPRLVEIELTDLKKSVVAIVPPASPGSWKWQVLLTCRVYS